MLLRPPLSTRSDTLLSYTSRFRAALAGDGFDLDQDRAVRLGGDADLALRSGGDAPRNAARMVGEEDEIPLITGPHRVGILLAAQAGGGETVADLHALDRVDAHHRGGEFAVELGIEGRAPAGRNAAGDRTSVV